VGRPDNMGGNMTDIETRHLFDLDLLVDHTPANVGDTPHGRRVIAGISGGTFRGGRLRGTVAPGGADWVVHRADGVTEFDVRITLRTDDGALIYMAYRGYRHGPEDVLARLAKGEEVDPGTYYQRVVPFFETAAPRYDWLNRSVAVATGFRKPAGPSYRVHEVL
jgi:hypothetical protein